MFVRIICCVVLSDRRSIVNPNEELNPVFTSIPKLGIEVLEFLLTGINMLEKFTQDNPVTFSGAVSCELLSLD